MMPMLRTLLRSVVMSTATEVMSPRTKESGGLPAVVREGLVGLGHLVGVLALLDRGAETVRGVEDLVHQALGHRLLAAGTGVRRQPAQGQRGRTTGLHL